MATDPSPPVPTLPPLQTVVLFPLTIASDLSRTAQTCLRRACGADISAITIEPLPDHTQVRLWISLQAAAYGLALHAVIADLAGAEFGAVRLARPLPLLQAA